MRTVVAALLVCLAAAPAEAARAKKGQVTESKPAGPSPEVKTAAKEKFRQGELDYKLGRFDAALASFTAAYELLPLAAFLFNIAQCHRQMGSHERAVFFYEGYLRETPEAPNRAMVEEFLGESRAELKRQEDERAKNEELAQREAELARAEAEAQERMTQIAAMPVDAGRAAAPSATAVVEPPIYEKLWFWGAVGGVVVIAVVVTAVLLAGGEERTELPAGSVGTLDRRALVQGGALSW